MQGELEERLERLLRRPPTTTCAGRTDAGVHALGQVVSVVDAPEDLDPDRIRDALNSMLPSDISVWGCAEAEPSFDARFSARSRLYVYSILQSGVRHPFMARTTLHSSSPLDVERMNEAAGHLIGLHDFTSFGRVQEGTSSERTLFELRCSPSGDILRIRARANSFIQQMVRSLVGTLIEVGRGRRSPDEMESVLAARDRSAAGPVAPPHGLCLVSVEYDQGWSRPLAG